MSDPGRSGVCQGGEGEGTWEREAEGGAWESAEGPLNREGFLWGRGPLARDFRGREWEARRESLFPACETRLCCAGCPFKGAQASLARLVAW